MGRYKVAYADRKSKAINKITYIQSKHGYTKDSFLLPGNFYNKTGKAELIIDGEKVVGNTEVFTLSMYFDDWLKLKSNTSKQVFDKTEFVLFLNRSLCDRIVGFTDCFEGTPSKLSQAFINGTGIYAEKSGSNQAEKNQIDFRNKIFKSLLDNSEQLVNSQLNSQQKESLIK